MGKLYTNERLENACEYALTQFSIPRYTHINSIFKINQYEEKKMKITHLILLLDMLEDLNIMEVRNNEY